MANLHYERDGSRYVLVNEKGEWQRAFETVAIAFAPDAAGENPVMFKHGPAEHVNTWAKEARIRVDGTDLIQIAVLESEDIPVEELNRIASITGYLGVYLKKMGYFPEQEVNDGP